MWFPQEYNRPLVPTGKCNKDKKKPWYHWDSWGGHMVHGGLKLYWFKFQYNKWQCGFSFIKQYFQIQFLRWVFHVFAGYMRYGIKIY